MRSGGEEVEGDEDSEDSKDKEDGEGEDDEWQHVCSDLTLFHTAQRVEDQIALDIVFSWPIIFSSSPNKLENA